MLYPIELRARAKVGYDPSAACSGFRDAEIVTDRLESYGIRATMISPSFLRRPPGAVFLWAPRGR